jgi:hypothetical protein
MEELLAVVRAQHPDGPRIDALVLDSRKNAAVPKGGEGASVKADWIRSSCCCLPWHSCGASGLQRLSRWARSRSTEIGSMRNEPLGVPTEHLRRIILVRWHSTTARGRSALCPLCPRQRRERGHR